MKRKAKAVLPALAFPGIYQTEPDEGSKHLGVFR